MRRPWSPSTRLWRTDWCRGAPPGPARGSPLANVVGHVSVPLLRHEHVDAWPCGSTTRYTYRQQLATFTYVSSTSRRSPTAWRHGRAAPMSTGVKRCTHRYRVTWSTSIRARRVAPGPGRRARTVGTSAPPTGSPLAGTGTPRRPTSRCGSADRLGGASSRQPCRRKPSRLNATVLRTFTEFARVRTHRNADKNAYRWYNDYRLRLPPARPPRWRHHQRPSPRQHRRREAPLQPHRERPTRSHLRTRTSGPSTVPDRRRVDQPGPRRHPLAPTSPQHRPRAPAPQPAHPRPRRELAGPAPAPATKLHRRPARSSGCVEPTGARSIGLERARQAHGRPVSQAQVETDAQRTPNRCLRLLVRSGARGFLPPLAPAPPE